MIATPTKRAARTRRDTGELTRDQKRQRERNAATEARLATQATPHKWERRGVQPEVVPVKPSGFTALMRLAAAVAEASDPAEKAQLEAEYRKEATSVADLTEDIGDHKLRLIEGEMIAAGFAPIVEPEEMSRKDWTAFHSRLMACKRKAAAWLARSRDFAIERWGNDFVEKSEAQMELALGIEPRQLPQRDDAPEVRMAATVAKKVARFEGADLAAWKVDDLRAVADALNPVVGFTMRIGLELKSRE